MSIFQKAVETYDANLNRVGVYEEGKVPLAPQWHWTRTADIEITINETGKFVQAQEIKQMIIMPVTGQSLSRTGKKPKPHPLCEQLKYLTWSDKEKTEDYLKGLYDWYEFSSNEKLHAVYIYVSNGTIVDDLINAQIIKDKTGKVTGKEENYLVCWRITGLGDKDSAVWTDRELQKSFQDYYLDLHKNDKRGLSMISGKIDICMPSAQFAKGILREAANAKLISSNDTTDFTYLGRFLNAEEALTIGFEDAQKFQNALRWVLDNQKVFFLNKKDKETPANKKPKRALVAWSPEQKPIPKLTIPLINKDDIPKKPAEYKKQLYKILMGYRSDLGDSEVISIAMFESPGDKGTLAMTYYNELSCRQLMERLQAWDENCCWYDNNTGTSSPKLLDIVRFAFGTEDRNSNEMRISDSILERQAERLVSCRLSKTIFPYDIMINLVANVSKPESYCSRSWRRLLFVTCAVIKKYYFDRFGEVIEMSLDPNKMDRNYQFGRLLAVLEKAESDVLTKGMGPEKKTEIRQTNAMKLLGAFVRRPGYTAQIIIDHIKTAYYPRLSTGGRIYYENLIGEIMQKISEIDEDGYNKPLNEKYVIGYYLQKNELYKKKEKEE